MKRAGVINNMEAGDKAIIKTFLVTTEILLNMRIVNPEKVLINTKCLFVSL